MDPRRKSPPSFKRKGTAIGFFVVALASPLLWLGFFSWFFSRRFAAQIRTPLALLRGAADKIAMRIYFKMLESEAKAEQTRSQAALDGMRAGFDGCNRAYLQPLLDELASRGWLGSAS